MVSYGIRVLLCDKTTKTIRTETHLITRSAAVFNIHIANTHVYSKIVRCKIRIVVCCGQRRVKYTRVCKNASIRVIYNPTFSGLLEGVRGYTCRMPRSPFSNLYP